MKVINKTGYETAALRRLMAQTYQRIARVEGSAAWWSSLRVTITPRARRYIRGYAHLHGGPIRMIVPPRCTVESFVQVFAHELMHAYGYSHAQFRDATVNALVQGIAADAWVTLPLKAPAKPQPPRDLRAERYAHVLSLEVVWLRKAKLAQTKLRALKARRRRYERLMAATQVPYLEAKP